MSEVLRCLTQWLSNGCQPVVSVPPVQTVQMPPMKSQARPGGMHPIFFRPKEKVFLQQVSLNMAMFEACFSQGLGERFMKHQIFVQLSLRHLSRLWPFSDLHLIGSKGPGRVALGSQNLHPPETNIVTASLPLKMGWLEYDPTTIGVFRPIFFGVNAVSFRECIPEQELHF